VVLGDPPDGLIMAYGGRYKYYERLFHITAAWLSGLESKTYSPSGPQEGWSVKRIK